MVSRSEFSSSGGKYAIDVPIGSQAESLPLSSDEFVAKVRSLTVNYPDDTRVGDLRIPPSGPQRRHHEAFGFLPDCTPPDDWAEFYGNLKRAEKRNLSIMLDQAMRAGFETIGKIREASEKELRIPKAPNGKSPRISQKGASFLKRAFESPQF